MPQQMAMPMGAPVPQMETVNYRNGCNKNDCNNHDKTYSRRDMCPPCSCNPCTPAFFAWCSPCHEQCKCKDNDSPDRQTSTKAPNGNVYQMPIPPIIYVPLPDLNQPKCPRCRKRKRHKESSSSCSSDDSTDDSTSSDESSCDSRDSRSRRREKNRDKYDICRRNGDCGSQSDEYQRGRRLKVAKRKREHKVKLD
ncbi:unnamed protein product [Chrysodeixis includens]|uniref:Uncharacterized protein n=1 Tax=Chrysodeixis includens TaxID=689277 RepID=A0A9N8L1Z3_CHRIL|nr:unnamed protein product [Chrysodeixis includens]